MGARIGAVRMAVTDFFKFHIAGQIITYVFKTIGIIAIWAAFEIIWIILLIITGGMNKSNDYVEMNVEVTKCLFGIIGEDSKFLGKEIYMRVKNYFRKPGKISRNLCTNLEKEIEFFLYRDLIEDQYNQIIYAFKKNGNIYCHTRKSIDAFSMSAEHQGFQFGALGIDEEDLENRLRHQYVFLQESGVLVEPSDRRQLGNKCYDGKCVGNEKISSDFGNEKISSEKSIQSKLKNLFPDEYLSKTLLSNFSKILSKLSPIFLLFSKNCDYIDFSNLEERNISHLMKDLVRCSAGKWTNSLSELQKFQNVLAETNLEEESYVMSTHDEGAIGVFKNIQKTFFDSEEEGSNYKHEEEFDLIWKKYYVNQTFWKSTVSPMEKSSEAMESQQNREFKEK